MKPERALIPERTLAHHSPVLLGRASKRAGPDLAAAWGRCGERMARQLAPALAPLVGCEPGIAAGAPRKGTLAALAEATGSLAAHSLLQVGGDGAAGGGAAGGGVPILISIDAEALMRMVDRAFGGRGAITGPLPAAFPTSALLMIERLEALVAPALARALDREDEAVAAVRRDGDLDRLEPFAAGTPLAIHTLTVSEPGSLPWQALVAAPEAALDRLVGDAAHAGPAPARRPSSPAEEPFGCVPLNLCAVIVDLRLPFAALARLAPGDELPVPVARAVPLMIGGQTIARGTIGAIDDRVALQLTETFQ